MHTSSIRTIYSAKFEFEICVKALQQMMPYLATAQYKKSAKLEQITYFLSKESRSPLYWYSLSYIVSFARFATYLG